MKTKKCSTCSKRKSLLEFGRNPETKDGLSSNCRDCRNKAKNKSYQKYKITDDNCVLFLWTTFPKLKEGIEVLESWGFKYITVAFVWVKQNPKNDKIYSGIGHWTNANAEIVLLGKKGKISRIVKNIKQIVLAHRGKHSVKPDEVRNRIVQLMGDLPRIELFARQKIEGWDIIEGKDNADGTGQDIVNWINKNYE